MKNKDTNNDFIDDDIFYCDDYDLTPHNIEDDKEHQELAQSQENEVTQNLSFDTILKILVTLLVLIGAVTGSILFSKNSKLVTLSSSITEEKSFSLLERVNAFEWSNSQNIL